MADQLSLFAPRAPVCPRDGKPLCGDATRSGCPGRETCERLGEQATARLVKPASRAPACLDCGGTIGLVDYTPGIPPRELAGVRCVPCADAIVRRWVGEGAPRG